jgi:hypothetical protein
MKYNLVTPINGLGIDHSEPLSVKDLSVGVTPIPMQRKVNYFSPYTDF